MNTFYNWTKQSTVGHALVLYVHDFLYTITNFITIFYTSCILSFPIDSVDSIIFYGREITQGKLLMTSNTVGPSC